MWDPECKKKIAFRSTDEPYSKAKRKTRWVPRILDFHVARSSPRASAPGGTVRFGDTGNPKQADEPLYWGWLEKKRWESGRTLCPARAEWVNKAGSKGMWTATNQDESKTKQSAKAKQMSPSSHNRLTESSLSETSTGPELSHTQFYW